MKSLSILEIAETVETEMRFYDLGFDSCHFANKDKSLDIIICNYESDMNSYLVFKFGPQSISVSSGYKLFPQEKKKKWFYLNYKTTQKLAEDMARFCRNYSKSFKVIRSKSIV